jgi:hypothetical protein
MPSSSCFIVQALADLISFMGIYFSHEICISIISLIMTGDERDLHLQVIMLQGLLIRVKYV